MTYTAKMVDWQNSFSEDLAQELHDYYVVKQKPVPYVHRSYGRFVHVLTAESKHGKMIRDDLISNPQSPYYQNSAFAEEAAIWFHCFVPGGYIPLHREFAASVGTVYLNKESVFSDTNGHLEWFESTDPTDLYSLPRHQNVPKFNCGSYFINPDIDAEERIFSPWHRVARNDTDINRYSIQIYQGIQNKSVNDHQKMIRDGNLDSVQQQDAINHYPEGHEIFDHSVWNSVVSRQWDSDHRDLIEQMTL